MDKGKPKLTPVSLTRKSFAPLIAGVTGGVVSTILLLPLDVIKVRLQVNETTNNNDIGRTRSRLGSWKMIRGIVKHEGMRGFYQGCTPAVIGSAVSWGGYFYFYEGFKRKMVEFKLGEPPPKSVQASDVLNSLDNFILSCSAGTVMVFLTNPIWLIKTRMQLQMKRTSEQHNIKPYKNMVDAARTIIREEGYPALYRGLGPALLLTSHGGVQFVVYEYLRKYFHYNRFRRHDNKNTRTIWERLHISSGYLMIGAVAKMAASTTTYPMQVIKSRMQQRVESLELNTDGEVRQVRRDYKSIAKTVQHMWQREGITGFFKGCLPNAIRVAPGAAVTFVVYETVMDYLE